MSNMKFFIGLMLVLNMMKTMAATVEIQVAAPNGETVPGAAVILQAKSATAIAADKTLAIMDQVDRQFKPRILVVPKGAPVMFPNSDSIKHHVYSFSPAKVFEIQLYKGSDNEPVIFNKAGVVELGCNVHDWMLGYIYVADSPYFAQLDENNSATIDVPEGEYTLRIWHPRISEADLQKNQSITVTENAQISFTLEQKLSTDPFAEEELSLDEFDIYE
ncbi:MAG: methylamine utilization protein [Aestuariibacter sp.]